MTEDPEDFEALPVVPLGDKKLRACLVTGLVKTEDQFLREGNDNVACLNSMIGDRDIHIEIDGGVTPETAPLVVEAGANVLVAGSAVFKGGTPEHYRANIAAIRAAGSGAVAA